MSSQPSTKTTTTSGTSTSAPLPAQESLFQNLWGTAGNTLGTDLGTPIPQHTVAGPTAPQLSGVQNMLNVAPTLGSSAPALQDIAQKVASGYFTNPQNDPNFKAAAQAAITPVTRSLQQDVIPQIWGSGVKNSGAGAGPGAYGSSTGGSPTDLAAEKAIQDWTQTAGNITSGMAQNVYNAGLNLIPQAPGLATGANIQALAPSAAQLAAGGTQQGFNQQGLQDQLNAYLMNTQQPLNIEQSIANILSTGGFKSGTQQGTSQEVGTPPSLLTQWLQGLTGGASAVSSLFATPGSGGQSAASGIGNALAALA